MDLSRSVGRSALQGGPPGHSNLLSRPNGPGAPSDSLNNAPPPSWHSSRDANGSGVSSDQQSSSSQFPPFPGSHNPASFDGYLQQMSSQQDLLSSSGGNPAGSGTGGLSKKRGRDDHDELESAPDSGTFFLNFNDFGF